MQIGTRYIRETFILALLSRAVFRLGWFQGLNEHFPKCLSWKLKFQKTETPFRKWKSTDNNDITISQSLENPCTFLFAKEKTCKYIFHTNSELLQNRTEK